MPPATIRGASGDSPAAGRPLVGVAPLDRERRNVEGEPSLRVSQPARERRGPGLAVAGGRWDCGGRTVSFAQVRCLANARKVGWEMDISPSAGDDAISVFARYSHVGKRVLTALHRGRIDRRLFWHPPVVSVIILESHDAAGTY